MLGVLSKSIDNSNLWDFGIPWSFKEPTDATITRVKYNSKARENWKKEGIERKELIEWIENYNIRRNRALKS